MAWEIVTNVPAVPKIVAFIAAFINIFIPGLGTIVAACAGENNVSKT